jgi:hypothetical protein
MKLRSRTERRLIRSSSEESRLMTEKSTRGKNAESDSRIWASRRNRVGLSLSSQKRKHQTKKAKRKTKRKQKTKARSTSHLRRKTKRSRRVSSSERSMATTKLVPTCG